MSERTVTTCDRCGLEAGPDRSYWLRVTLGPGPGNKPARALDLCPDDAADLQKWIEGKGPKK